MAGPLYRAVGGGRGTPRETAQGSAQLMTTVLTLTTTGTSHETDMMRGTAIRRGITTGGGNIREEVNIT